MAWAESSDQRAITSIREVQGEGAHTPLADQVVTIKGQVTASYPKGGFNGFYIQDAPATPDQLASSSIFVYLPKQLKDAAPEIGQCLEVSGKATEYYQLTQVVAEEVRTGKDCKQIDPLKIPIPATDEQRERFEGTLLAPTGEYTVTDNYNLLTYGQIGLALGTQPLFQATDVVKPGEEAAKYEAENLEKLITLDDGSSWTLQYGYKKNKNKNPLPYLDKPGDTVRTGARVTFTAAVILDYRFQWNLQPVSQVVGKSNSPVQFENTRPSVPQEVGGNVRLATFNVLNYFTHLGQDEPKCKSYTDINGQGVTANRCQVRGAFSQSAFQDQEGKIVLAINGLKADLVGLEEIENSTRYNQGKDRDESLKLLVEALNKDLDAKGSEVEKWTYVPSPKVVPNDQDGIRTALIYKPGKLTPLGESVILDDEAFNGVARSPLAQRFEVKNEGVFGSTAASLGTKQDFVVIVNHFKSKGSVLKNDPRNADQNDGQGNNNYQRVLQSKALAKFADGFAKYPVFIVGDLNSYSQEDPIRTLEEFGYTRQVPSGHSYQYGGRIGSLDHVLTNQAADKLITGLAEWEINKDEPIALEYSRRLNTTTDVFEPNSPYRASDHDPVVIGLQFGPPEASSSPDSQVSDNLRPEGLDASTTITPSPSEGAADPSFTLPDSSDHKDSSGDSAAESAVFLAGESENSNATGSKNSQAVTSVSSSPVNKSLDPKVVRKTDLLKPGRASGRAVNNLAKTGSGAKTALPLAFGLAAGGAVVLRCRGKRK